MANDENIKQHQFDVITASQQREIASKGGKASAEARKAKKDLQYFARMMLDEIITDKKGNEMPTRYAALKSVLKKVLKEGDHNALKTLAQLAGELPKDAGSDVVINVNYNGVTKEAQDALDDL